MTSSTRLHFDKTITLGNVFTLLTILVSGILAWGSLKEQVKTHEITLEYLYTKELEAPRAYVTRPEYEQTTKRLERIESKLDQLITIQMKKND